MNPSSVLGLGKYPLVWFWSNVYSGFYQSTVRNARNTFRDLSPNNQVQFELSPLALRKHNSNRRNLGLCFKAVQEELCIPLPEGVFALTYAL